MPDHERRLREGDISALDDRRRPRRAFLIAHGFELGLAIVALVTAVQFILEPAIRQQSAIGALGTTGAWVWTALYLLGGAGMLFGLIYASDRVELAGLQCFIAAALVNAASIVQARGPQGIYVALIFGALVVGAAARIYLLLVLRRVAPPMKTEG